MTREPILQVRNLKTQFHTEEGTVRAVDGVSFDVYPGEIVGLVGESGAGKSVTAMSILRLIESPGKIVEGEIRFKDTVIFSSTQNENGRSLHEDMLSDEAMRNKIRGNEISLIFQDPTSSLNPTFKIGSQLRKVIQTNRGLPRGEAKAEAVEMLRKVGIPEPADRYHEYPHQFSGGMCQRVLIAMAFACEPSLIVADEPTTSLDVTVEGQILELVKELQQDYDTSFIWVTHDLSVVAEICDRVNVMYLGKIVEQAPIHELFSERKHPYTDALLNSIPRPDKTTDELKPIAGIMPEAVDPPTGCNFHERCPHARDVCAEIEPRPKESATADSSSHKVSCFRDDSFDVGYWNSDELEISGKASFGKDIDSLQTSQGSSKQASASTNVGSSISDEPLVEVDGLTKHFKTEQGILSNLSVNMTGDGSLLEFGSDKVQAISDVSLEIRKGEVLGLVGESGSGKSTLGRLIARLIKETDGAIYFDGEHVTDMSNKEFREIRKDMQFIFQDSESSLNPRMKVGTSIMEPMRSHGLYNKEEREERARELLSKVGLDPQHFNRYPHAFSGGQRQRINLARALSVNPDFIICDEPVSALDVSIQAQVLQTMEELKDEFNLTYLFISHDLSVIRYISDRVAVLYLGEVAEHAEKEELFENPQHPYTKALLESIPVPEPGGKEERTLIEGDVPSPINPPSGCRFRTRCPAVVPPEGYEFEDGPEWHQVLSFIRIVDRKLFDPTNEDAIVEQFFDGDLPAGEAGQIVQTAISHILEENWDQATTVLNKAFIQQSVCAQERPSYTVDSQHGSEEHVANCHRNASTIPHATTLSEETTLNPSE